MAEVNVNPVRMLFVVLVFFSVGHVICDEVTHIKSGTDYTFKPSITGNPQSILWKYKGNKVVEFENEKLVWYQHEGRAKLNTKTGDFILLKLNTEDSGRYESEIQMAERQHVLNYDIKVVDALPKPNVTCEVNGTEAKLVCSVDSSADFKWNGPDIEGEPGHTITVSKEGSSKMIFICIVTNEVSVNSTELHLKDCFRGGASSASAVPLAVSFVAVLIAALLVLLY